MKRLLPLLACLLTAGAVFAFAQMSDDAPAGGRTFAQQPVEGGTMVEARGNLTLADAARFTGFELYAPGLEFESLLLTSVHRANGKPVAGQSVRSDLVGFIYGKCEITGDDSGCMPPIQVQVWNACERNSSSYAISADRKLQVRGAPAAYYENYGRLEIYTGKSTVVIFSSVQDPDLLLRVARSLRGVNVQTQPEALLPQPSSLSSVCGG